jgi:hypothetical protein
VFVACRMVDGTIRSAGAIDLGLSRDIVEELEQRLAELPVRRLSAVASYLPEVSVLTSTHGLTRRSRPRRDPARRRPLTSPSKRQLRRWP